MKEKLKVGVSISFLKINTSFSFAVLIELLPDESPIPEASFPFDLQLLHKSKVNK
jgi:hypothetical protein